MIKKFANALQKFRSLEQRIYTIQLALGRIERKLSDPNGDFQSHEFRVFSQWGEDGLIQYLLTRIPIANRVFVEFGVEDYTEANTRFLLESDDWSGLVIDGSQAHVDYIVRDTISWRHTLATECAFITAENINELISKHHIQGDIGLLSVDIDGNDYWVWKAIDVISPRIVIVEYNATWGPTAAVTTPYDPSFQRTKAHYSNLYWGASVTAFAQLADVKGYDLVGGNRAGNNLFFVRRDVRGSLPACSPGDAYRIAHFRDSRDKDGRLTLLGYNERKSLLGHLPLVDVISGRSLRVEDI